MKKNVWLLTLVAIMSLGLFQACDDDDTINRYYPISWMPVTDLDGESLAITYTEGEEVGMNVRFKVHNGNEVQKITLYSAIVDEASGEPVDKTVAGEYGASDYSFVEDELQYAVDMTFLIEKGVFIDKKVQLSALFETENGTTQDRVLAEFSVLEYFEFMITDVPYMYMFNNK
ncbi:MAG: hypothetical protein MI866_17245, partial [Bacteroidales bacterium]|nr:hypothetical protein [Bacteroidales bacterium]